MDDQQITATVVAAQPMYRHGVVAVLREHGIRIEAAGSVADGAALSATDPADVVLVEFGLPGVEDALQTLGSDYASRVIILLPSSEQWAVAEALQFQCGGLLLRDVAGHELQSAVAAVATGFGWISPELVGCVQRLAVAGALGQRAADAGSQALTRREREVLVLVAAGHSNRRIAVDLFIAENTVKNHVRSILVKLDLRSRVEATRYAVAVGLVDAGTNR